MNRNLQLWKSQRWATRDLFSQKHSF